MRIVFSTTELSWVYRLQQDAKILRTNSTVWVHWRHR